ncbi:MAG: radical SAM family heme chaperone HemW [Gammaproteobacteria bacterium]
MQKFTVTIPLSLYIHIPWCVRKCPYCDFNSHESRNGIPEDLYVEALLKDLNEQLPRIWGRRLVSIFFGGGTPSLFSSQAIDKILTGVNTLMNIGPDIEITLEANPGTVDESRFIGFRQAGINRLSLGIQSLQDEKLQKLGRIHHREHALRAIDAAQKAGFDNMNLDLMHGLPGQSITDAMQDLKDALAWKTPHLSWYQLTIEPNTVFYSKPPRLPEDETLWDIQEEGKKIIAEQGLEQYEVSAYAKPGKECLHNLNYWEFGDYLGIGAGAHSKITDVDKQVITRHWQMRTPKDYLDSNKAFVAKETRLSEQDVIFEFMLNALRLTKGVPMSLFTQRTGLETTVLEPMLIQAKMKKLLVEDSAVLKPTELGRRFLNDLVGMFLNKS